MGIGGRRKRKAYSERKNRHYYFVTKEATRGKARNRKKINIPRLGKKT